MSVESYDVRVSGYEKMWSPSKQHLRAKVISGWSPVSWIKEQVSWGRQRTSSLLVKFHSSASDVKDFKFIISFVLFQWMKPYGGSTNSQHLLSNYSVSYSVWGTSETFSHLIPSTSLTGVPTFWITKLIFRDIKSFSKGTELASRIAEI